MSLNTFGHLFRVTTWGESHGPALGATVDGCPPGVPLEAAMIQHWLDRRKPGQNKYTTQRREPDAVRILSGVYEGRTTGTPIQLMIENQDQRSKDYGDIAQTFRPGHADITYHQKYGIRDPRGGGRSSARETAARVAAGVVAQEQIWFWGAPRAQRHPCLYAPDPVRHRGLQAPGVPCHHAQGVPHAGEVHLQCALGDLRAACLRGGVHAACHPVHAACHCVHADLWGVELVQASQNVVPAQ